MENWFEWIPAFAGMTEAWFEWIPAFAGMTVPWPEWIPAFAGMTEVRPGMTEEGMLCLVASLPI